MGEKTTKNITGESRVAEIVIASPHNPGRGRAGVILRSEWADADGSFVAEDQVAIPADAADASCVAFIAAAGAVIPGLTLEQFQGAVKAGAYAARAIVREKVRADQLVQLAKDEAELAAKRAKLQG